MDCSGLESDSLSEAEFREIAESLPQIACLVV
jgi:hypothetical protein